MAQNTVPTEPTVVESKPNAVLEFFRNIWNWIVKQFNNFLALFSSKKEVTDTNTDSTDAVIKSEQSQQQSSVVAQTLPQSPRTQAYEASLVSSGLFSGASSGAAVEQQHEVDASLNHDQVYAPQSTVVRGKRQ